MERVNTCQTSEEFISKTQSETHKKERISEEESMHSEMCGIQSERERERKRERERTLTEMGDGLVKLLRLKGFVSLCFEFIRLDFQRGNVHVGEHCV